MKKNKAQKGITLVALIITIVILLILASAAIGTIRDNGILINAKKATTEYELAEEKENVILAAINSRLVSNGTINKEDLESRLYDAQIYDLGETLEVYFDRTKNCYVLDKIGNLIRVYVVDEIKNPGDPTKGNTLDGSQGNPYEISCIEDLIRLSKSFIAAVDSLPGQYVVLTKDLDFKSPFSYGDSERIDYGDINKDGTTQSLIEEMQTGKGFLTIGSYNRFDKNFDGNNHEIRNLYVNNSSGGAALFLQTSGGSIKNLGVTGTITASGVAGGIVGTAINNTKIDNCYNKCNVTSTSNIAGGIGAIINGIVTNCYNTGTIESQSTSGRARRYRWAMWNGS